AGAPQEGRCPRRRARGGQAGAAHRSTRGDALRERAPLRQRRKTAVTAALILHVVLWHSYRADEERGLQKCVQVYNAAHPEVSVEAVAVPYDAYAYKLEAAIPRGNGPDLFVNKHDDVGEFSRAGLIQPMDVPADHFLDGTVEPLRLDGHLWGLPLT